MKKFIILCLLFCFAGKVNADCITGFACSLKELEEQERIQTLHNVEIMQNYLKRSDKPIIISFSGNNINYSDLFLFNKIF